MSLNREPFVSENFRDALSTGGRLEEKYLAKGTYEVSYQDKLAFENYRKYEIWYPTELEQSEKKYPVLVICNGTGACASLAIPVFEHFASWGFVVIATEEEYSWNGFSAEMSVRFLEKMNAGDPSLEPKDEPQDPNITAILGEEHWSKNPFKGKIDMDRIALSGHSQGGVGVFTAANEIPHKNVFKALCALSPTNLELAEGLEWHYEPDKTTIPVFLLSGTGPADEFFVVSGKGLAEIYEKIPSETKIMMRRTGANHGDTLYYGIGYETAFLLWQLCDDKEAEKAFAGQDAELSHNNLYQDIRKTF